MKKVLRESVAFSFALVFMIGALGFVGSMDFEEEVSQQNYYAEMVCAGHWPDYENRNPNCKEVTF